MQQLIKWNIRAHVLWIAGAASCYLSLVSVPVVLLCNGKYGLQMPAESPEYTAKHPQTNANPQARTQAHTPAGRHTTLSIWLNCISSTTLFISFTRYWITRLKVAWIPENTLRPHCRELSTAYMVIYSCIFAYPFYCVVHGGLILSI